MSDCQKCIHKDVCDQASRQMWSRMSGETNCSNFKDHAKYAEVRHGRWERYPGPGHIRCTGCKVELDENKMPVVRTFCPNCGAKMDKEGDADA